MFSFPHAGGGKQTELIFMSNERTTLLKFPCDFPLKIIGLANTDFEIAALMIVRAHAPNLTEGAITTRLSKDGKYLAMTIIIPATSQEQLDNLYQTLTASESVIMVL